MNTGITITMREAFGWFAEKAKEFSLSPIPDAERVAIVLQRMREDIANKKIAWDNALKAEVAIQDPEDFSVGALPTLRARMQKYEDRGALWGREYNSASAERQRQLSQQMKEADATISALEIEISTQEAVLVANQDTTRRRREAYDQAKTEYEKLRTLAPALVAQTNVLKEAQEERMRAIQETAGNSITNAGAILAQLQAVLDDAKAGDRAAALIDEETAEGRTLDEIMAAEDAASAQNDRVSRWINKQ
ncbi:hypothetical protein KAZ66_00585 [Candidatus Woesebacteria bacterium]|nr:hypothetical protein [Candidatus Woesebacteria bacterium]